MSERGTPATPADIRALFTQDAAYYTEPCGPPWEGRDEIVRRWLDRKDEPGQAQFNWHPLAVTSEVAIIQGEVAYPREGHTYSNLWIIRLDTEGRCTQFTEWWMRHPQPDEPPVAPSNQPQTSTANPSMVTTLALLDDRRGDWTLNQVDLDPAG